MMPAILFGGVALAGVFLGKIFLDKQMAKRFYKSYEDAIMGEILMLILKGLKQMSFSLKWFCEKISKEPMFLDSFEQEEAIGKAANRQKLCPHLGWIKLCPTLSKKAFFLLAEIDFEKKFDFFMIGGEEDKVTSLEHKEMELNAFLKAIYWLERGCFKTSEALVKLTEILQTFENFNAQEFDKYNVSVSKYDLQSYDKSAVEQISLMKKYIRAVRIMLAEKTARLDELVKKQNDFNKLAKDEQKAVSALFDEMKKIYALITSDFVRGGAWIDTQTLINETQIHCKPSDEFNDESKKTKSSKQNDIWPDKLIAWADEREIALKGFERDKDKLRNVKELYLSYYGLTALPDEFENLQQVEILRLGGNKFKEFPKVVCKLTKLEELDLCGCDLISLPDEFANLQQVEILRLNNNKFKEFPKVVCKLTKLKELDLCGCDLISLPDEFANLQKLENLVLKDNKFTKFPRAVCKLTNLKELDLAFCKLNSLPDELANLQQLKKLYLSGCDLISLPDELEALQKLEWLDLDRNEFKEFPKVICKLTNLKTLDLIHCKLSSLPDELANLQQLSILNLFGNPFKEKPSVLEKLKVSKHFLGV